MITLSDDSGLEVDALDGLPGLRSARFAPKVNATDSDRRMYLLQRLQGKPRPWKARFHCVVAIVIPAGLVALEEQCQFAEGVCLGEIIPEERGNNGFGYDPVFLLPEIGRTMAELSIEEKNRLSHRSRAVRASLPILVDVLKKIK
jgi:XTP/dITP diphosphohydrolase